MAQLPPGRFGVEADTMERFIEDLYTKFGGSEAWATAAGVPRGSIENLRAVLLGPTARTG
jgi:hypothetical protein